MRWPRRADTTRHTHRAGATIALCRPNRRHNGTFFVIFRNPRQLPSTHLRMNVWCCVNGASSAVVVPPGHAFHLAIQLCAGEAVLVFWSTGSPLSVSIADDAGVILDEQWGPLISCAIGGGRLIRCVVGASRRCLSSADGKLLDAAHRGMELANANDGDFDVDAWMRNLVPASRLTTAVSTFFAALEEAELCVVRRKMSTSAKKIPVPRLRCSASLGEVLGKMKAGSLNWKRSSGSFSTMMRFVQRSKDTFRWEEDRDVAETQLSAITFDKR